MACHFNDNVYTQIFTPREYQVELLDAAREQNTIELSWQMRSKNGKRAIFILDPTNITIMMSHITLLTDLRTISFTEDIKLNTEEWTECLENYSVIVVTIEICSILLENDYLDLSKLNLIVLDDCLYGNKQVLLEPLMHKYRNAVGDKPRILGLAAGLLGPGLKPECLEHELQRVEGLLCSSVNTSSELVTLLRFCCRPHEHIVEYQQKEPFSLVQKLMQMANDAREFLSDHRFDPSEIYADELLEELQQAPDPKKEPLKLLEHFLGILKELGPWAADQAALCLLAVIEKLKVKVLYERHYLLLCLVSTVFVKVRATCDDYFQNLTEVERIMQLSTPKVLRFLEVLKYFKPPGERPTPETVEVENSSSSNVSCNKKGKAARNSKRNNASRAQSEDTLCALVFVSNRFIAKVIYALLYTMSQNHDDYWWISALYSVEKIADPVTEPRDAEIEHRRQEDVLRRYRIHDCNVMVATSFLEEGCDLPKCNLVVCFDPPTSFHSYVQCKARARASDAYFLTLVNENELHPFVDRLSEYIEVQQILLRRCRGLEPEKQEELEADSVLSPIYQPSNELDAPSVTYSTAIMLINRYCAKLPSDTFTRLTPLWNITKLDDTYSCTLRLPINSPIKQAITQSSDVNPLLACRAAAFKTCQLLHESGELDDNLQPIGKKNFKASEDDWGGSVSEGAEENINSRPGTTKRRQYYYKRISDTLTNCLPVAGERTYFYKITMVLTCPLPEEQNTRGRRIYPPEESIQGFGILTCKPIPKICAFPIFTRSGEVSVDLELCSDTLVLDEDKIKKISEFLNYTFTNVLRLQRYLMLFNPQASDSGFLIAPTIDKEDGSTNVDWDFVELIYENRHVLPQLIPEEERVNYTFDPSHYKDAVVMPWYRNQDQPQYFYVAEIYGNLNPTSNFPGSEYATFEEYYHRKYSIQIQNKEQHLLDVDHTSARLNFLTPRYVNRKGVALPTSSEETKRAKRENLEQKQILVPELCAIHPFPASLWRKAVCLPCILYRINALLLADQIRRNVAIELGLGKVNLPDDFNWPCLNFGWNLSDVLKKSREQELHKIEQKLTPQLEEATCSKVVIKEIGSLEELDGSVTNNDCTSDEEQGEELKVWTEIGTWSNDMANSDSENPLPVRYASPTSWLTTTYDDSSDLDETYSLDDGSECGGLRIEFTGDNTAEAVEEGDTDNETSTNTLTLTSLWQGDDTSEQSVQLGTEFREACECNKQYILSSNFLIKKTTTYEDIRRCFQDSLKGSFIFSKLKTKFADKVTSRFPEEFSSDKVVEKQELDENEEPNFSFDKQPNLAEHPGPSPSIILQGLTMSNANDGINLERLETIGDSFLKYAITNYLYSKYENVHEGKLSHLRSKQVSNLNLYRLGKQKLLGECMIATKFDPHDNWLPPCYYVPRELEKALMDAGVPANYWSAADVAATRDMTIDEVCQMVRERGETLDIPGVIPYNIVTQHSIPDKSIADCVEALIGAYLIDCGPRGALLFMAWLGMKVLPQREDGSYGELKQPQSPLLRNVENPEVELQVLLDGYHEFENNIGYKFRDPAYLLQAFTHASYSPNALTDCYQRLEFLGDAVLDYLITRHLYEDNRMHSPGALTDLRSALVNNTIFASLAARHSFHKFFRHLSPGLQEVIERFVRIQEESGHALVEELYLLAEHECKEVEDVEVPKALGDVFESVAGAIFLDSGMSLDAVWNVYFRMMRNEIERFSNHVPKSPIRELLELEPETAKFGKPEKLADGRRVRVTVEVFGKGVFKGIGRNYRIAKCTAAKCALRHLKRRGLIRHVS